MLPQKSLESLTAHCPLLVFNHIFISSVLGVGKIQPIKIRFCRHSSVAPLFQSMATNNAPIVLMSAETKWWNDSVCRSIHTFIDYTGRIDCIRRCVYQQSNSVQLSRFHGKRFHTCTCWKRLSMGCQCLFSFFRFTGCASAAWSKPILCTPGRYKSPQHSIQKYAFWLVI